MLRNSLSAAENVDMLTAMFTKVAKLLTCIDINPEDASQMM